MSFGDEKQRRRRMPVLGERPKATGSAEADPAGDAAPQVAQEDPPAVSGRMRAMLAAGSPERPEEAAAEAGPKVGEAAGAGEPDVELAMVVPLRAARELRPAISDPPAPEPETAISTPAESEEADPEAPGNRAISLTIRLGSMMAVVLTGVFAATLIDLGLGLQTRFQGLGILATYLVVLAVILTPSLNPRTRRQWIVVIGGFAGVICAIALGSAVARLMLMTKDFQHTGLYVHLAVEFGVMFAFWGLASLVFVEILRRAGMNIGSQESGTP